MPVKIDWLNIDVRDGEITAAESFKIREEIPSILDALLALNHEVVSKRHFLKFFES